MRSLGTALLVGAVTLAVSFVSTVGAATRLSLAGAVEMATHQNASVEIAGLRVSEAKSRLTQSHAVFFPGLNGTASGVNRTFNIKALGFTFPAFPGVPAFPDLIGPVTVVDARLQVTQTLFDYASWVRVREAGEGVKLSEAERTQTAESAAENAARRYVAVARGVAIVAARQQDLDLARELADLAAHQERAGVSPGIDVTRAQTQVATSRAQLLLAQNTLARSRMELARALGIDPDAAIEVADSLTDNLAASAVPAELAPAVALAYERRPELRAERLRGDRAKSEKLAIQTERLPRLEALADWGVSGQNVPDAIPTYSVGLAVTMPLLDGGRREGRVNEQNAMLREAEVREDDLRRQVSLEVNTALLDLASGRDQAENARERLRLAQEELSQARERFANGVAGNIEVIDAQSSLIRAREVDIDARAAIALARVSLARAAGVSQTLR
jgi:outer membrane protein TolC